MRINKVHLEDYRIHKDLEITFESDINLLLGKNGSGKTSILEAIGYALFGSNLRSGNQKDAIRRGAKKAVISVEITGNDSCRYTVKKSIPGTTELYKENDPCPEKTNVEETIKKLCGIKGELKGIYDNVIVAKQNEFVNAFKAKPADREKIFNRIFNTDIYEEIYKGYSLVRARTYSDELNSLNSELKGKKENLIDPKEKKNALKKSISDLKSIKEELGKIKVLQKSINKQNDDYNTLVNDEKMKETQKDASEKKKKILEQNLSDAKKRLQDSERAVQLLATNLDEYNQYNKIFESLETIEKRIDESEKIKTEMDNIKNMIEKYTEKLSDIKPREDKLDAEIKKNYPEKIKIYAAKEVEKDKKDQEHEKYATLIKENKEAWKALSNNICPYLKEKCDNIGTHNVDEFFGNREKEYQDKLDDIQKKSDILKKELEGYEECKNLNSQTEKEKNDLKELKVKCEKGKGIIEKQILRILSNEGKNVQDEDLIKFFLAKYNSFNEKIEEIKADKKAKQLEQKKLRPAYDLYQSNKNKADEKARYESDVSKALKSIEDENKNLEKIKNEITAIKENIDKIDIDKILEEKKSIDIKVDALNKNQGELENQKKNIEEELDKYNKIKEEIENKEKQGALLNKKLELTNKFRENIKVMGKEITKKYLRSIAITATENFRSITNRGDEILWSNDNDAKYEVSVRRGENIIKFGDLSGGEQVAAAISLRGAMSSYFTDSKFSILDEPTNNLDKERRESLADHIGEILKDLDQSIIVTHDDTFREMAQKVIEL